MPHDINKRMSLEADWSMPGTDVAYGGTPAVEKWLFDLTVHTHGTSFLYSDATLLLIATTGVLGAVLPVLVVYGAAI
eukprot:3055678-Rhodomonas_salina.8